ncbi:MAG: hypothetical protein H6733_16400 [Alphaproteobacteria bacterium]|nr:hypothetical protein [Alphaproteobacteria bacterium]
MLALLTAAATTAFAHGPAPAALDVLTPSASGCATVDGDVPGVVRSNDGVWTHAGDGTYTYGCPSRWGDSEQALLAVSGDGAQWLLAGADSAYWSDDGGCHADDLDLPSGDVPVTVGWSGATGWLVTRQFDAQTATVWTVDGALHEAATWDDAFPDGLVIDDGRVWLAGARPTPFAARLDGADRVDALPLPALDGIDRLTPRAAAGDVVFLVAGAGGERTLVRSERGGEAVTVSDPAFVILGPVPFGDGWMAVIDDVVHTAPADGSVFTAQGDAVDWTCLDAGPDGQAWACVRDTVLRVSPDGGGYTTTSVFTLSQLAPPEPTCQDDAAACTLDWAHFGSENALDLTDPATCPGDARTEPGEDPDGTPCGCTHGGSGGALGVLLVGLAGIRRRSARSR